MPELNTQALSSKSAGQSRTQFARKELLAGGVIATQRGKTATINLETRNGRIEDVLRLFTTTAQPSVFSREPNKLS
jgi:hypothetical protein